MKSKSIETLVSDIYSLFNEDVDVDINEKDINDLAVSIASSIVSSLSRNRKSDSSNNLRLSMIGHPDRKIWYKFHSKSVSDGETITPQTAIKFLYGDILEHLLVFLAKAAGHTITDQQKEVMVSDVVGHNDAIVDGVLVDFKSASAYSFKKFQDGSILTDDPFGYIAQISAYAHANNIPRAGFVVIDKANGDIVFTEINKSDRINPEKRINDIKSFISKDTPPPRCYDPVPDGKSGNLSLAVGCVYCDYKLECWNDCNNGRGLRQFKYANGPKYFTMVMKEPQVEEII